MARAYSIWVVTRAHDVMATFTVKHELVSWLKGQKAAPYMDVQRFPDGGRGQPGALIPAATLLA